MEITGTLKALVQLKVTQYNYYSFYVAANEDDEYAREQVQHLEHEIRGIKECIDAMTGSDCSIDYRPIDNGQFDMIITRVTIGNIILYRR